MYFSAVWTIFFIIKDDISTGLYVIGIPLFITWIIGESSSSAPIILYGNFSNSFCTSLSENFLPINLFIS